MHFTNEINARNLGAKDLPERSRANVNNTAFVLIDPSRERSWVFIRFTKPIPLTQLFDSEASAQEDSTKRKKYCYQ